MRGSGGGPEELPSAVMRVGWKFCSHFYALLFRVNQGRLFRSDPTPKGYHGHGSRRSSELGVGVEVAAENTCG